MRGTFTFAWMPLQMGTVRVFQAPDPRNRQQTASMTLSVYRMVNVRHVHLFERRSEREKKTVVPGTGLRSQEVLGLRSNVDGRYHMLPVSLTRLWQKGRIRTEDLPRVLAEVEYGLKTSDFYSARLNPLFKAMIPIFAGAGVLALVYFAFQVVTPAPASHRFQNLSVTEWLSRPQQEATLNLIGGLPVAGAVPVGQVQPVAGMAGNGYDAELGWYASGDGDRLVLVSKDVLQGSPGDVPFLGTVVSAARLNLPAGAVSQVAAQVSHLDTRFIACSGWAWQDGMRTEAQTPGAWLAAAGISFTMAALIWALFRARERRIAKQEFTFAERFALE